MPYIKEWERELFDAILKAIDPNLQLTAGRLNYLITRIIDKYLGKNPHYSDYNEVIGVLECVKLELYRRQIAKYEDKKWTENGDVYEKR